MFLTPANDTIPKPRLQTVLEHFFIQPDQQMEELSIRHVFECVSESPPCKIADPSGHRDMIEQETIRKIQFRYDLFSGYEEDFFKDFPECNREALLSALISDDLLSMPWHVPQTFDRNILLEATEISARAAAYEEEGMGDDEDETIPREVWFLAIVNVMEQLNDLEENLQHHALSTLIGAQQIFFPIAGSLIKDDTEIGAALHEMLDRLDNAIMDLRPAAGVVAFPGNRSAPQPL